ncbi:MAG TPA: MFS transporter [Planctomycetota bacterium]|nr:MFS transporter [Planctomycetota bacterium]
MSTPSWWREIEPQAWRALVAAGLGWMLDAMDVMLYAFALGAIRAEFGLDQAGAGALQTATLLAAAAGGLSAGVLADRFGRARVLSWSVLVYSCFTALTATAQSVPELVLWRVLVGLGQGAEWSAGALLVAETWPAAHRGKAIGLMQAGWAVGYILAAGLAALVLPGFGWRPLFVIGFFPALLVVWIRRSLAEPEVWRAAARQVRPPGEPWRTLARAPFLRRALLSTGAASALLFAYWGLFTWIPNYLARPREAGGAGLGIVRSTGFVVVLQLGALAGYVSFGFLADRFGRKPTFLAFVLGAAACVPVYGWSAHDPTLLWALSPLVGFFGHGYFSLFGAMLAELFPSAIRGAAQGLCYNLGRVVSAAAPAAVGAVADRHGIGTGFAMLSLCYLLGALLVLGLPETRGAKIE